jgi:phage N-6-adenine-methyltransferase
MREINDSWFTSNTDDWGTPQALFDELNTEFGFTVDVCANENNFKVANYFDVEKDGLAQPWEGVVWCNPPYGRRMKLWIAKAYEAWQQGATVVCLIPARTDTVWWHSYAAKASEIRFIKGRLKYEQNRIPGDNAPFPSAIVIFRSTKNNDLKD